MCGYTTLLDPIRYDIQLEDIKKHYKCVKYTDISKYIQ